MPEVSVIIRNFNRRERLARPLDSVLAQTFTDFEIVFVDDASTDGSIEWVREPYGHLEHLRIAERAVNGGTAAAANTGVTVASGRYVAFLDSDDEWLPTHLAEHVCALRESHPAIASYSDYFQAWEASGIERLGGWIQRGLPDQQ